MPPMAAPRSSGALRLVVSGVLVAAWVVCSPPPAGADPPATRHALFLNSYEPGYNWADDVMHGVRDVIATESYPVELWIEHLDSRRFGGAEYEANFEQYLRFKYRTRTFHVIVASDDAALAFLLQRHDRLFGGIPVVFMGINNWRMVETIDRRIYTGLLEVFETRAIVELVLRLRPETRRLIVIGDAGQTALSQLQAYRELVADRRGLELKVLDGTVLSLDQILESLRDSGPRDAVLTTAFTRDATGRYFPGDEALSRIALTARAPVYSASVNRLGQGLLAGSENVGLQYGREAARKVMAILRGLPPSAIAIEPAGAPRFIVDFMQARRWGIEAGQLPPNAILVNVPSSFYSTNKYLIWAGIAFIALQTAVIFTLTVNVSRRRQAERELAAHAERLAASNADLQRLNASLQAETEERQQAQEQLRQAQKMEAIGRLAGGVAHDFNNLLTVIGSYAAMLLEGLESSHPMRACVEEVQRASERAARLTNQLLAFSRKQMLVPVVAPLNEVVRTIEPMLRRLIGEDVTLEVRLCGDPTLVRVDLGQIEQVIVNLAANARDAMPTGGRLTIETRTATFPIDGESAVRGWVQLIVSDSGEGMPPDVRRRIFEPFFTTKNGTGTGLGLSTVYGIVSQSGGLVSVDSEPGAGTTFTVSLPATTDAPTAHATPVPTPRSEPDTARILLVEDQEEVRTLAARLLRRRGYTVIEAASGAEGLAYAASHPERIDLLLTDVVMPGISGRTLADQLLASRPDVKVLFMSGYTEDVLARLDPAMAFIPKPFTPTTLVEKVGSVLRDHTG
jgi:signal transduction histidine kinase